MLRRSVRAGVALALLPVVILLAMPCASQAQIPTPVNPAAPFEGQLGDDLFGMRSCLAENGINFYGSSTQFYQGVTSGGLDREFRYGGRVDLLFHIDGEKAGLWKGFFIDIHDETLYGVSVNTFTGALLPTSIAQSYPVADDTVNALTGLKFTQALSENFALFAGKINTLDGFNQPFAGGWGRDGFFNASFVFPTVFARTIPYSTLGGGFAILKDLEPVFAFMCLDTNNTPTTTGFSSFFDNGVSLVAQLNVPITLCDLPGHQGFLASYSNRTVTNLDNLPYYLLNRLRPDLPQQPPGQAKSDSWAVAYMFDQMLVQVGPNPKRGLGVFGTAGLSDGNPNPVKWAANIGLGGVSPIPGREYDTFGVGYAYTGYSSSFKNIAPRLLPLGDEQVVELFYNVAVTPWCRITPDFQVGIPIRERVDTYTAFGVRAQINF